MGSPLVRTYLCLIPLSLTVQAFCWGQGASSTTLPDATLVERALAIELRTAQNKSHPMRYRLRKSSPRLTTTKDLIETQDGTVARLIAVNDQALSEADAAKEENRLNALLGDPGKQRHRKQAQEQDTSRALEILRMLPKAFVYQYAGQAMTSAGEASRFTFSPNPQFNPPDLETEVLTALNGEIWVDSDHQRVIHLEGHLTQDVDFGWGILGRLYKGGWIAMDQEEVSPNLWRIVRFKMAMTGRVVFRVRNFQTTEEESQFVPVPLGLTYRQGIQMLRAGRSNSQVAPH